MIELEKWMANETTLMDKFAENDAQRNLYLNAFSAALTIAQTARKCPDITFEEIRDVTINLLFQKPLSPIEDVEESWASLYEEVTNNKKVYQCVRYPSLYKEVDTVTGKVRHFDRDRYICVDINDPKRVWTGGIGARILEEMCPITFPYMPDDMPIKVYIEEFLYHAHDGAPKDAYDTYGILYFQLPNSSLQHVYRYFKNNPEWKRETLHGEQPHLVEITKTEYFSREKEWQARLEKEEKNED